MVGDPLSKAINAGRPALDLGCLCATEPRMQANAAAMITSSAFGAAANKLNR
jgi:hypothetical protein